MNERANAFAANVPGSLSASSERGLQIGRVMGLNDSMKDAVRFKVLAAPLTDVERKELIAIQ